MYKYTINANSVIEVETGHIRDVGYSDYMAWLALGNTPLPADPPPLPSQDDIDTSTAKLRPKLAALAGMTPAQIIAWRAANVATLAQELTLTDDILIAISVLLRRL